MARRTFPESEPGAEPIADGDDWSTAVADAVPVPIWHNQGVGGPGWVNHAMVEFLGPSLDCYANKAWLDILHPDDRGAYLALSSRRIAARAGFEITCRMRRSDGEYRWMLNRVAPWTVAGEFRGYVGSCIDVTDQHDALERLDADRARFELLVRVLSELNSATQEQLPGVIDAALGMLGRFLDVDRVGVVGLDERGETMELDHVWHSERVGVEFHASKSLSLAVQPGMSERMRRLEAVWFDDTDGPPDSLSADRDQLRARGVRSNAQFPMIVAGRFNGFLFLDDLHGPRSWTDALSTSRLFAHALSGALERHRAEHVRRESERRFKALFSANPQPMWVWDLETLFFLEVNDAAVAKYGYSRAEFLGMRVTDVHQPDDLRRLIDHQTDYVPLPNSHGSWRLAMMGTTRSWRHALRSGPVIEVEVASEVTHLDGREVVLAAVHDITERRVLEHQLRHQAFHDSLTGLANRALLEDRLEHALAVAQRDSTETAVLVLDLDGFKTVNDSLGHSAGDDLLIEAARRLVGCVRPADTVARLGGDEFAVLMGGAADRAFVRATAERVEAVMAEPFPVQGHDVVISASVGMAIAAAADGTPDTLLRDADLAMYAAKEAGRGRVVEYVDGLGRQAEERLALLSDVHHAVDCREFVLHYQPSVDLATGRINGIEALLRWQHPERGLLGPDRFLPLLEDSAVICEIGRWVLDEACGQARAWRERFGWVPPVAVNIAARQLRDGAFLAQVNEVLATHELDASGLVLEIKERGLVGDAATTAQLIELRRLGVGLAIDDFGSGYSSVSYLRQLPVDILKIDRSFVTALDVHTGASDASVSVIAEMARTLELRLVAKGIEHPQQLEILRSIGCDAGQGYLFARPGDAEHVTALLSSLDAERRLPSYRPAVRPYGSDDPMPALPLYPLPR